MDRASTWMRQRASWRGTQKWRRWWVLCQRGYNRIWEESLRFTLRARAVTLAPRPNKAHMLLPLAAAPPRNKLAGAPHPSSPDTRLPVHQDTPCDPLPFGSTRDTRAATYRVAHWASTCLLWRPA